MLSFILQHVHNARLDTCLCTESIAEDCRRFYIHINIYLSKYFGIRTEECGLDCSSLSLNLEMISYLLHKHKLIEAFTLPTLVTENCVSSRLYIHVTIHHVMPREKRCGVVCPNP